MELDILVGKCVAGVTDLELLEWADEGEGGFRV
jgi:hypothetical protein